MVRTLGEGGIATVYHVRHVHLDVPQALKLLNVSTKQMRDRLITEGKIQAKLAHRNIVHVSDVFEHEGQVGLVMDFVEGFSLAECLKEEGAMSQDDALVLFRQILDGVRAAHDVGVTHRDLKPANILLTSEGTEVVAKITDFGIAKVMHGGGTDHTRAGTSMGTPGYMAPEQIRDSANVDHRADIFALGAILYEMLSGRRAFKGHDPLATMNMTVGGSYTRLLDVADRVSPEVAEAVAKALNAKPEYRFASCREFEQALFGTRAAGSPMEPTTKPFVSKPSAPLNPPFIQPSDTEITNPTLMPEAVRSSPSTLYADAGEPVDDEATEPLGAPVPLDFETATVPTRPAEAPTLPPVTAPQTDDKEPDRQQEKKPEELDAFSNVPGVETKDLPQRVMELIARVMQPVIYVAIGLLKYLGPVVVSVSILGGWAGSSGKQEITVAQERVDTVMRSTTLVMDDTQSIVDEIAPMTANPEHLQQLREKYVSATDPVVKAKIGKELYVLLDSQLAAVPASDDPVETARRRELERKVKAVLDKQAELARAQKELDAASQTFNGQVAKRFRMVPS